MAFDLSEKIRAALRGTKRQDQSGGMNDGEM